MKNITPAHHGCMGGACSAVYELEDGRLLFVGKDAEKDEKTSPRISRHVGHIQLAWDEKAIIIDRALLSTIRDEVRKECAEAVRQMRWAKETFPMRSTTWSQEHAHGAIAIALESAVAAICALKETPCP